MFLGVGPAWNPNGQDRARAHISRVSCQDFLHEYISWELAKDNGGPVHDSIWQSAVMLNRLTRR